MTRSDDEMKKIVRDIQLLRNRHDDIQMKLMDANRILDYEVEHDICTAQSECEIKSLKEILANTICKCAELEIIYLKEIKATNDEFYLEK